MLADNLVKPVVGCIFSASRSATGESFGDQPPRLARAKLSVGGRNYSTMSCETARNNQGKLDATALTSGIPSGRKICQTKNLQNHGYTNEC